MTTTNSSPGGRAAPRRRWYLLLLVIHICGRWWLRPAWARSMPFPAESAAAWWMLAGVVVTTITLALVWRIDERRNADRGGRAEAWVSLAIGIAVFIIAVTAGSTIWLSKRRGRMDMNEWAVGGRSFGGVLLWFLSAGEIYTTFAFLGAAGWAYSRVPRGSTSLRTRPWASCWATGCFLASGARAMTTASCRKASTSTQGSVNGGWQCSSP